MTKCNITLPIRLDPPSGLIPSDITYVCVPQLAYRAQVCYPAEELSCRAARQDVSEDKLTSRSLLLFVDRGMFSNRWNEGEC
jgi:hypothetical protein